LAELAHLRAATLGRGGEVGVDEDTLVQPVPDLDASLQGTRQRGPIPVRYVAAGGGRADEYHRRASRQRVLDSGDDRYALSDADAFGRVLPRPRRVDNSHDLERRVAEDSDRRLRGGARALA